MSHVFVIVLNYKNWQDTRECLETLLLSDYDDFTAFVIDNNSQNDSLEHLTDWITSLGKSSYTHLTEIELSQQNKTNWPKIAFVQNQTNKGFAGGMNMVLDNIRKEGGYIWLLNPDMTVERKTLSSLVTCAKLNPVQAIIGCNVRHYKEHDKLHFYAGGTINFNSGTIKLITEKKNLDGIDYISGGSLFTHAHNFEELGLLPDEYFLYWEETDWCYRARQKNYKLVLCENAVCYDKVSATVGKGFLSDYYYTRNGLYFLSKYRNKKVKKALLFNVLRIIKRIFAGQPERAKGVYKGMLDFINKKQHAYK